MDRKNLMGCLACLAVFAFLATPALAQDDEDALRGEIEQLRTQFEALSNKQQNALEREIQGYLAEREAFTSGQGDKGIEGVSLTGRFTGVSQTTVGLDPSNVSTVAGDVDLDFWMQATENLGLFIYLTASATRVGDGDVVEEAPPYTFGPFGFPPSPNLPNGLPNSTFSGLFDGIGVDGTVPVRRGSITVREAGIQHAVAVGAKKIYWEIGALDPRNRFLQNAFADDENTQFLNNLFDDDPAISWLSDASGRFTWGIHTWYSFGTDEMFTLNVGYFNTPGQFWDQGQLYVQLSVKLEVGGREMNIRGMWMYDNYFNNLIGTGTSADNQWGVSWDWLATDKIGLFARIAGNTKDVNPMENNASIGAIWSSIFSGRPNDAAGLALGLINANRSTFVALPKDTEFTFEIYYKFALEDGKLQITPSIMWVGDPGGRIGYIDDTLLIFGIRIFVPF